MRVKDHTFKLKKIFAFLALLLVVTVAVSCGGKAGEGNTSSGGISSAAGESSQTQSITSPESLSSEQTLSDQTSAENLSEVSYESSDQSEISEISDESEISEPSEEYSENSEFSESSEVNESSEVSEITPCDHPNGYTKVVKKYTYYEDGTDRFTCPDCGFVKDTKTTKVIKRGKTTYTYEETESALKEFTSRYGLKVEIVGKSVEGRNIYACILGDHDSNHHVLVGAAMHGKEYMNTTLMLDLIEYYTIGEGETYLGTLLSDYVDGVCFHIIPMINPDGVTISQKASATAEVAKFLLDRGILNDNLSKYFRVWKSNANGVDLNRNFPAGWEDYDDTVWVPNYWLYKGPSPASEPETKAIMEYTLKYDFDVVVSYHSYGEVIYWKYGNDSKLINKCKSLAQAVSNATGYSPVSPANEVQAGYKDWAISVGIPALTVETGSVDTPLPDSQYPKIWRENWKVFAVIAKWVKMNT